MRSRTHAAARRCFLGPHRKYDPFTKTFMSLTPGQGHVRRCHPRPPALRLHNLFLDTTLVDKPRCATTPEAMRAYGSCPKEF